MSHIDPRFIRKGYIMIKVAIFDLDGTLADTMGDLMTAMNGMLRELGFPARTKEELLTFIQSFGFETMTSMELVNEFYPQKSSAKRRGFFYVCYFFSFTRKMAAKQLTNSR